MPDGRDRACSQRSPPLKHETHDIYTRFNQLHQDERYTYILLSNRSCSTPLNARAIDDVETPRNDSLETNIPGAVYHRYYHKQTTTILVVIFITFCRYIRGNKIT